MRRALVAAAILLLPSVARADVDAASLGPYTPQVHTYDRGSIALDGVFDYVAGVPSPNPVEVQGRWWAPAEAGTYPLIVLMHGSHASCYDPAFDPDVLDTPACDAMSADGCPGYTWVCEGYDGSGPFDCGCTDDAHEGCELRMDFRQGEWGGWPCDQPYVQFALGHAMLPVPSFEGYDETARLLASHGFVVASISANGVWGQSRPSQTAGIRAGAALLRHHLDLWLDGSIAPIDGSAVGLMGHSRGGEAVAMVAENPQGVAVRGAMLLGATNGYAGEHRLEGVPLAVVTPYCDGDVVGLEGNGYFDALQGSSAPAHLFTMAGANHNFFNTVWTPDAFPHASIDDAHLASLNVAAPRAADEVLGAGGSVEAFFDRRVALAQSLLDPACGRGVGAQRLSPAAQRAALTSVASAFFRTYVGREDDAGLRALLDGDERPAEPASLEQDVMSLPPADAFIRVSPQARDCGGGVPCLDAFEGRSVVVPQGTIGFGDSRDPHAIPRTRVAYAPGEAFTLDFDSLDVSQHGALVVRFGLDAERPRTDDAPSFALVLRDADGGEARVPIEAEVSRGDLAGHWPKQSLTSARAWLDGFDGVDLGRLVSVGLAFDEHSGTGGLLLESFYFVETVDAVVTEIEDDLPADTAPVIAPVEHREAGCTLGAGTFPGPLALLLFAFAAFRRRS